jgi:pimeloyl-ACP methyl ester carboxylesterase
MGAVQTAIQLDARAPFRRGRFQDLPERPHRPHTYYATAAEEVAVTTPALGRTRAHVRVHGSGPPLLLVHGLMTSSYSFRYVLEPLGRRYTVYAPDLPGAGRSDRPLGSAYHPQAIAEWIGALQGALGIRGARVVGNSMGGYLCMRLALSDPEAIGRLVNVHSPGIPEARLVALGAVLALPGARAVLSRWIRRRPLEWAHANVHYWDESLKSLEEAREYGGPLATPEGVLAFIKYLDETMAVGPIREFQRTLLERRARSEPFPVPLLHVYARRDPMVPPRFGELLAEQTGAKLVWVDEASHFMHVDAIDRFLSAVDEFLAGDRRSADS